MARIRSVHPSLFTNEAWVSCSLGARLLFIGLWTDADDGGVFEWKPLQIKMRLLPADNVDVQSILDELSSAGLIKGFTEAGKMFGAIKDFQKFQRPQKPRMLFPLPEDLEGFVTGIGEPEPDLFADQSRTSTRKVNQRDRRMESEDGVGGGTRGAPRRKPETTIPEGFPGQDEVETAETQCREAGASVDIPRQAKRFRNYVEQNDRRYRDWPAAWRNWIDREIGDRPAASVILIGPTTARQRAWMKEYLEYPNWWKPGERGPNPDQPGCKIAPEIMAEFQFVPAHRRAG